MNKDEALRLALLALVNGKRIRNAEGGTLYQPDLEDQAITAIKQALEETQSVSPEPEPVAWGVDWGNAGDSSCVSIIKRLPDGVIEVVAVEYGPKRKPLTDEEIDALPFPPSGTATLRDFVRIIEAAHGITGEQHEQV